MRVNPDPTPTILAALATTQQDEETALLQMSSGRKVNKPSDDPAAAAVLVENHDASSRDDQYLQSVGSLQAQMQNADQALNSIVLGLQRAISLGVQGANGTLSDANRASVVQELQGIQQQLMSTANLTFQGQFVFAGTATKTQPFVADPSTPSGVRYAGNGNVNQVAIGNGFSIQVNLPGSQLFTAPGSDMFQSMNDLITALQSGVSADAAIASVRKSFDYVTAQRVFYGNAMAQMDSQQTYLNSEKLGLSTQEDSIAGADMATVVSNLTNAMTARNATLAAVGRVSQTNLFDFLK